MALNTINSGADTNFSTKLNENFIAGYTQNGLQLIETLTDREVTYSKGRNAMIGESYVDATGQTDSVDTANIVNGTFDTDKYYPTSSASNCEIPHNIPSGTFKDIIDSGFFACKVSDWEEGSGIDFKVKLESDTSNIDDATEQGTTATGTDWKDIVEYERINGLFTSDLTADIRSNNVISTTTARVEYVFMDGTTEYSNEESTNSTTAVSKTFTPPNPTKRVRSLTFQMSKDQAAGYGQYVSNILATNTNTIIEAETGWIEGPYDGESIAWPVENFTAFTSEPTQYIVRLKPRSTSPTAGVPAIYGSVVLLE